MGPRDVRQFALLVVINVFVGGMVGLERSVLPLVAESDFGIASATAALAFIATFGATKAVGNLVAGGLADRFGRRRVLVAGWLVGVPVPLLIIAAPAWGWIVAANVLLGVNQALTWSMTINMKIDIAGPARRGWAAGINEAAGYGGVAVVALASALVASRYGLRPEPFYIGVGIAVAGLALSLLVRDTRTTGAIEGSSEAAPPWRDVFRRGSWSEPRLASASLAGLLTNLKDGALWGLLPLLLAARDVPLGRIGVVVAVYPAVWGLSQALFGPLSDRVGRVRLIVGGLALQAVGVAGFVASGAFAASVASGVVAGVGTAMAYPTLQAHVSDVAGLAWRASALGVYRFWRDLGYAIGALGAGAVAEAAGVDRALAAVAGLVAVGVLVAGVGLRRPGLR